MENLEKVEKVGSSGEELSELEKKLHALYVQRENIVSQLSKVDIALNNTIIEVLRERDK